jgi:hypothetical protein
VLVAAGYRPHAGAGDIDRGTHYTGADLDHGGARYHRGIGDGGDGTTIEQPGDKGQQDCIAPSRPCQHASHAVGLATAVVVVMTVDVVMPDMMAVMRGVAMIDMPVTVTMVIEVTGLRGAHRKAKDGSDCKCGQAFDEHLNLLSSVGAADAVT